MGSYTPAVLPPPVLPVSSPVPSVLMFPLTPSTTSVSPLHPIPSQYPHCSHTCSPSVPGIPSCYLLPPQYPLVPVSSQSPIPPVLQSPPAPVPLLHSYPQDLVSFLFLQCPFLSPLTPIPPSTYIMSQCFQYSQCPQVSPLLTCSVPTSSAPIIPSIPSVSPLSAPVSPAAVCPLPHCGHTVRKLRKLQPEKYSKLELFSSIPRLINWF